MYSIVAKSDCGRLEAKCDHIVESLLSSTSDCSAKRLVSEKSRKLREHSIKVSSANGISVEKNQHCSARFLFSR